MLGGLPADARTRFERLHARCLEMRGIAAGVRGAAGDQAAAPRRSARRASIACSGCSCACCVSKTALDRFLQTMNEQEITTRLDGAAQEPGGRAEPAATIASSGRCRTASRWASCGSTTTAARRRTPSSCRSSSIASKARSRRSPRWPSTGRIPDFLSSQVDSAAESMRQTEKAVSELQHLTGLADQLEEPPAILEADLREVLTA